MPSVVIISLLVVIVEGVLNADVLLHHLLSLTFVIIIIFLIGHLIEAVLLQLIALHHLLALDVQLIFVLFQLEVLLMTVVRDYNRVSDRALWIISLIARLPFFIIIIRWVFLFKSRMSAIDALLIILVLPLAEVSILFLFIHLIEDLSFSQQGSDFLYELTRIYHVVLVAVVPRHYQPLLNFIDLEADRLEDPLAQGSRCRVAHSATQLPIYHLREEILGVYLKSVSHCDQELLGADHCEQDLFKVLKPFL